MCSHAAQAACAANIKRSRAAVSRPNPDQPFVDIDDIKVPSDIAADDGALGLWDCLAEEWIGRRLLRPSSLHDLETCVRLLAAAGEARDMIERAAAARYKE